MRKFTKSAAEKKRVALPRPPSGELTCGEWQVEDMLSEGESTEIEIIQPPERTDQKASQRTVLPAKAVRKGK
jgi:hypothetical protein